MNILGESELHYLLKMVGMAWLYNQNCNLVATECYVYKSGDEIHELDRHHIIDVLGVGKRFIPYVDRIRSEFMYNKSYDNILRGLEVKVSRSDFKNGFVTSGCNYHYLITPMRLIAVHEIPNWFGLLEYNKYKFKIYGGLLGGRFNIEGLRIVKKPKFLDISTYQFDRGLSSVSTRLTSTLKTNLSKYFQMIKDDENEV